MRLPDRHIRILFGSIICALATNPATAQEKRNIEIPVSLPAARATELVKLVALRRDVGIASNEGGVMQLEPIRPRPKNPTEVRLRINVVSLTDSTSIVAVSANWFSPFTARMQSQAIGRDRAMQRDVGEPVEFATKGWRAELWKVVNDFADAVRAASPR
jgi:hypothetical protein